MKNLLLLLFMVPFFSNAQQEGTVIYQTTASLNMSFAEEDGHSSEFKNMIPKERVFKNVLSFKDGKSLFTAFEDEEPNEIRHSDGGNEIVFKMATPDNKIYHDLSDNKCIESREFLGKYFLITGEPSKYKWKLTGESKSIAGYNCQKATFSDTTQTIVAWFTPEIPVGLGPGKYGQLPGLIIAMDIDNGSRIVEATEVNLKTVDKSDIVPPKKGKNVTEDEFNAIVDQKMKEMGGTRKGGGVRMIITEDRIDQ